jgi:hypothetical protein
MMKEKHKEHVGGSVGLRFHHSDLRHGAALHMDADMHRQQAVEPWGCLFHGNDNGVVLVA